MFLYYYPTRVRHNVDRSDMDDELQAFFDLAGVTPEDLKDRETRNFIFNFIASNGGLERAKEETRIFDFFQKRPLMLTYYKGKPFTDEERRLLEPDSFYINELQKASKTKSLHPLISRVLINGTYQINTRSKLSAQRTPLLLALRAGCSAETLDLLLTAGADINDYDTYLNNALLSGLWGKCSDSVIRELLKRKKSMLHEANDCGMKPLMCAVISGCSLQVFRELLEAGANISDVDNTSKCLLYYATKATCGQEISNEIIHLKLDLIYQPDLGQLGLFTLSKNIDRHDWVVKALINSGSDLTARDILRDLGQLGLFTLTKHIDRHDWVVKALIKAGSDLTTRDILRDLGQLGLFTLSKNIDRHDWVVKALIKAGSDLTARDIFGNMPLKFHWVASDETVELYLKNMSVKKLQEMDVKGETLLHTACRSNCGSKFVGRLMNAGLTPAKKDSFGNTALHLSTKKDNTVACRYLLRGYPGVVEIENNDGHNVLEVTTNVDCSKEIIKWVYLQNTCIAQKSVLAVKDQCKKKDFAGILEECKADIKLLSGYSVTGVFSLKDLLLKYYLTQDETLSVHWKEYVLVLDFDAGRLSLFKKEVVELQQVVLKSQSCGVQLDSCVSSDHTAKCLDGIDPCLKEKTQGMTQFCWSFSPSPVWGALCSVTSPLLELVSGLTCHLDILLKQRAWTVKRSGEPKNIITHMATSDSQWHKVDFSKYDAEGPFALSYDKASFPKEIRFRVLSPSDKQIKLHSKVKVDRCTIPLSEISLKKCYPMKFALAASGHSMSVVINTQGTVSIITRLSYKLCRLNVVSSRDSKDSTLVQEVLALTDTSNKHAIFEFEKLLENRCQEDAIDLKLGLYYVEHRVIQDQSIQRTEPDMQHKYDSLLAHDLYRSYLTNSMADFVLKSVSDSFPVNRGVLSARSSVLADMFHQGRAETGLSDDTLKRLLRFLCANILEDDLESEPTLLLYEAACQYKVPVLQYRCRDLLIRNLDETIVMQVLLLANAHQDSELKRLTMKWLIRNSSKVMAEFS